MLGDANSLVVALDHAPLGLAAGLDHIERKVEAILAGHPDGLIANYGWLKRIKQGEGPAQTSLIARLDGNRTYLAGDWTKSDEWELFFGVDACVRIGAQAGIVNLLLGSPAELASLNVVARAVAACDAVGVPLVVSAMYVPVMEQGSKRERAHPSSGSLRTRPQAAEDERPGQGRCFAARMAFELGADYVIAYDTVDPHDLTEVKRWCPSPILAQGAPPGQPVELAAWACACVSSGARGVVAGRAVWQDDNPTQVVTTLRMALPSSTSNVR